jgi:hypothetical protein
MAATALAVALTAPSLAPAQDAAPRGQGLMGRLFSRTSPAAPMVQPPRPTDPPQGPASTGARPATDSRVFKTGDTLPEPINYDDLKAPAIPLPTEPLEPYLLTKDNGPFMVMAKTFRGPDAARYAQALAIELRNECKLPAYVFFLKIKPMRSNIYDVAPTAPPQVRSGLMSANARYRMYDEAAVLVGDCKTIAEANKLLRTVKAVRSRTIDALPNPYPWRQGLKGALITTNPYAAAQTLYPGHSVVPAQGGTIDPSAFPIVGAQPDPFVRGLNKGRRSLLKCPAPYTLPVAEFSGRAGFAVLEGKRKEDPKERDLKKSPLVTAHLDAEKLADQLAKTDAIVKAGYPVYVYHDRTTSRVTVGAFNTPDDPRARRLREDLIRVEIETKRVNKGRGPDGKPIIEAEVTHLAPWENLMPVPHP